MGSSGGGASKSNKKNTLAQYTARNKENYNWNTVRMLSNCFPVRLKLQFV